MKRVERFEFECPICNTIVLKMMCQVKNKKHVYCSKKCMGEHRKTIYSGENNHFYGRTHTDKTKEAISKGNKNRKKSIEEIESIRYHSKKRFPNGLQPYQQWLDKYGKEEADKREAKRREKLSFHSKGERNPMYGKPSPQGSGNGWSGWYKGWFFRSILELSYMINVIEANNLVWESAETKELAIPYVNWDGKNRTYRADFLINKNILVEIKPKRLISGSPNVILKAEAARKFCETRGLTYELYSIEPLKSEFIIELRDKELIKFTDKYEKLFQERYKK